MGDTMATALATKLHEINDTLALSQEDIASIVGSTARSVSRWASDEAVPQRLSRQRLIELAYVAEAVAGVLKRSDANLWLMSPNRLLDHDRPADRIHAGDYRSVLALLDALGDGIAV
jgi:transcriptional regulator with XRE-family HTH domain